MKIRLNRILLALLVTLVVAGAAIVLLEIWGFDFGEIFFRLIASIAVLVCLVGFLMVVKTDFSENQRLKDDNYID